jgi:pyruvate formate lyase activating enzyme
VDLYKVDLKSFSDRTYRKLGCVLKNVLDTLERLKIMGFWVEVVTLIVPGFNDSDEELGAIAKFLVGLSPDIPWHVTAFHPEYKMADVPRTRVSQLIKAYEIGKQAGLRYVYPGNLPGLVDTRENTCCPECGTLLIRRFGFEVLENAMRGRHCPRCDAAIAGVWEEKAPKKSVGSGYPHRIAF